MLSTESGAAPTGRRSHRLSTWLVRVLSIPVAASALIAGLGATAAHAQTITVENCGAYRDIPSDWVPVSSGNMPDCAGSLPGFSYTPTSPSDVDSASWVFNYKFPANYTVYVDVWVPSTDAGAYAEYDIEYADAPGVWHVISTINQETHNGIYEIGDNVDPTRTIEAIRVHSTTTNPGACGETVCYLAEAWVALFGVSNG